MDRWDDHSGLPFDVEKDEYVFSGGTLYKTLGDSNNTYYKIVHHILEKHSKIKFIYAGTGDDSELKKIIAEFPNRAFHINERKDFYYLIQNTMRIDDIFVRYLMQYEILLGQVTNEHTQKEVTDYIKKVYNPANKDRQIGFQLTRRPRRKYKEDDLTYNRNLLGHGDIEKAVSEEKIRQLSRSIMDVLWFSLWNKAE